MRFTCDTRLVPEPKVSKHIFQRRSTQFIRRSRILQGLNFSVFVFQYLISENKEEFQYLQIDLWLFKSYRQLRL
jgi:hypothetical protein